MYKMGNAAYYKQKQDDGINITCMEKIWKPD